MKKIFNRYTVMVVLVIFCAFSTFIYFQKYIRPNENLDLSINKNWTIVVHSQTYNDVSLGDFGFDIVNRGDTVVLKKVLPKFNFKSPTIQTQFWNTAINIYLDNKMIYSFGEENYKKYKLIGCGAFFIDLPDDYVGKEIKIVLRPNENKAFSTIMPFKVGENHDLYFDIIKSNPMALIVTSILIVFGFTAAVSGTIILFFSKKLKEFFLDLILIGALSFLCGIWCMSNFNFIYIFSNHSIAPIYTEYLSFYLAYIPFAFIIFDKKKYKYNEKIFHILMTIYFTVLFLTVFLQVTNILHLPALLLVYHAITIVTAAIALKLILSDHNNSKANTILKSGYIFTLFAVTVHIVLFNMLKFVIKGNYNATSNLSMMGIFILIFTIFLSNIFYWRENYISAKDKMFLNKLAYEDILTGLYNRQKAQMELKILQESKADYSIVTMDLNNLKKTNDTMGHVYGDNLLKSFALCFKTAFEENLTCRVGGDEFVAIVNSTDISVIEKYLENLKILSEKINKNELIQISYAYGYATTNELPDKNYEELFKLADSRMYTMKQEMKRANH